MRFLLVRAAADAGALALITVTGIGVVTLVPELRARRLFERLGWAWLLGAAWLGCGAYAASFLLHVPIRPALWIVLAAPVPLVAFLSARRRQDVDRATARSGWPVTVPLAVLACSTAVLLAEAFVYPVREFDGRMTWGVQARWVAAEETVLPRVLVEPEWSVTHPRYPLLMPILQALPMQLAGDFEDSRIPRAVYPPFLLAAGIVLFAAARSKAGTRAAAVVVLLFGLAPFVAFENHGGASGTYSDLPLAGFLAAAVFLLGRARAGWARGAAAGLLLAAAVLTKNEGLPLAVAVLAGSGVVAFLRRRRQSRMRNVAVAAVFVVAAAGILLAWKARIPNRNDEDYVELLLHERPALREIGRHLVTSLPALPKHLFAFREWALTWVAIPLLMLLASPGRRGTALFPAALVVAAELFLMLAGWSVGWGGRELAEVTASRGALQVLPLVLYLAAPSVRRTLAR